MVMCCTITPCFPQNRRYTVIFFSDITHCISYAEHASVLNSGLPFSTFAITTSPILATGSLFSHPLITPTEIRYMFSGSDPELVTAPTRRGREIQTFRQEDLQCPCFDIFNTDEDREEVGTKSIAIFSLMLHPCCYIYSNIKGLKLFNMFSLKNFLQFIHLSGLETHDNKDE